MTGTLAQYIILETSIGKVELELYVKHAPITCKNFVELAKQGYYNQTIFHRYVPDSIPGIIRHSDS